MDYLNTIRLRIRSGWQTETCGHYLWLLFWPLYLLRYFVIENCNPAAGYTVIHCPLDDRIPFQEGFLIFYCLWYVLIVGMHLYTAVEDPLGFRKYSKFLLISMSASTAIFLLFPSCQQLRPEVFPRDNLMTDLVSLLYSIDTNTNVFPSEHVIGSLAAVAAAAHSPKIRNTWKFCAIALLAVLICLSTLFLKQHSVLDLLAALPISAVTYYLCYGRKTRPA